MAVFSIFLSLHMECYIVLWYLVLVITIVLIIITVHVIIATAFHR